MSKKKKNVVKSPVVETPVEPIAVDVSAKEPTHSVWWYFADDNYLGLKVVVILIVFMFCLWYFNTYLLV